MDVKLDVQQSELYDLRKSVFLAPDSGRLFEQIQRQAVDQAREDALNSTLLRTAEDKAQAILENMLAPLNRPVEVIFRE